MELSRRAVRRRVQLVRLLENPPCSARHLRRALARVLSNHPDRWARARVWDELTYWEAEQHAATDAAGMFDDLGDGQYGPLDIDKYHEQAREELEAALDMAASYARPAPASRGERRAPVNRKREASCPS